MANSSSPRLARLEGLARLLDSAVRVPGLRYRVGFDALIGLIPGLGDVAGGTLSAYIVWEAARFGLPRATLLRMVSNIVIELVIGAIPFLGDLFDVAWKANMRNLALLKAHLNRPGVAQQRADRRFLVMLLLALILLLVAVGFAVFWLLRALLSLLEPL